MPEQSEKEKAQLVVDLSPGLHLRLKLYAVKNRVTMKELAARAIEELLNRIESDQG